MKSLSLLVVALLVTAPVAAHSSAPSTAHAFASPTATEAATQQPPIVIANATAAAEAVATAGYPLPADPAERFVGFLSRTDLAEAGDLSTAVRVARIMHVTDLQLVDDDARTLRTEKSDSLVGNLVAPSGERISGAQRPQEEYGDEILHAMIDVINVHHGLDAFDFAVHTGDNIDNALENELMRYIDLVEGSHTTKGPISGYDCLPDGQSADVDDDENDVVDRCTSLPEHLVPHLRGAALDLPWYSSFGNHDGLVQGNAAPNPSLRQMANEVGRWFLLEPEYIGMHFADLDPCGGGTVLDDFGHGFGFAGERLCDDDPDNDGYYAFDQFGVRFIMLDTVNDEIYQNNENAGDVPGEGGTGLDVVAGLSEGALDVAQFAWLADELEENRGRPIIIMAHHTAKAFYSRQFDSACGPPGCMNDVLREAGFLGREDLLELLDDYPEVIAFIGGHTHQHRVSTFEFTDQPSKGYWNIETSGLLDHPQETRIIELWLTDNGTKGFFALDPIGHIFNLAQELARSDEQHDPEEAEGGPKDQRALLWFDPLPTFQMAVGHQPGQPRTPGTMSVHVMSPLPDNETGQIQSGNHTLKVHVTDDGIGLRGLGVMIKMAAPARNGQQPLIDMAPIPLADVGGGAYEATISLSPGLIDATITATDPTGRYGEQAVSHVFDVFDPDAKKAKKGSPALGAFVPVALALAAVAVSRRR